MTTPLPSVRVGRTHGRETQPPGPTERQRRGPQGSVGNQKPGDVFRFTCTLPTYTPTAQEEPRRRTPTTLSHWVSKTTSPFSLQVQRRLKIG